MSVLSDVIGCIHVDVCLLLMTLCSQLRLSYTMETNTTYPPYRVVQLGQEGNTKDRFTLPKPNILHVTHEEAHAHKLIQPIKTMEIKWLNSSTDSISFSWKISDAYVLLGFIQDSVVEYLQEGGKYTSHPLSPSVKEYTFTNLDVDTTYTICVYMNEIYGAKNSSSITHSRCVKINTIEYIRRDSVVIMMLTLGYYLFMGILGCLRWKRKCWEIEKRNRARASECASTTDGYAMQMTNLEQKERLLTRPGRSIETTVT